jgi:hypothetical protein
VEEAVCGIAETDLPRLYQLTHTILVLKRLQDGSVAIKQFSGPGRTNKKTKLYSEKVYIYEI